MSRKCCRSDPSPPTATTVAVLPMGRSFRVPNVLVSLRPRRSPSPGFVSLRLLFRDHSTANRRHWHEKVFQGERFVRTVQAAASSMRSTSQHAPSHCSELASMLPPMRSSRWRAMARPRPEPSCARDASAMKNGWNRRDRALSDRPSASFGELDRHAAAGPRSARALPGHRHLQRRLRVLAGVVQQLRPARAPPPRRSARAKTACSGTSRRTSRPRSASRRYCSATDSRNMRPTSTGPSSSETSSPCRRGRLVELRHQPLERRRLAPDRAERLARLGIEGRVVHERQVPPDGRERRAQVVARRARPAP